jgi:hypothetical protein
LTPPEVRLFSPTQIAIRHRELQTSTGVYRRGRERAEDEFDPKDSSLGS